MVEPEHDGLRLDNFLTALLPDHSRSQIQRLIKDGHVRGPGSAAAREQQPFTTGQAFEIDIPAPAPATPGARGAAAADHLPGPRPGRPRQAAPAWSCIRRPVIRSGTLVNALLHHVKDLSGIGGELRPGIVHRLDRGTSGVMVVAKNDRAHQELVASVPRSRGREGVHGARLGRRPGRAAHRRADRPRSARTGRRCRRARGARAAR